jgi:hypothetical protein
VLEGLTIAKPLSTTRAAVSNGSRLHAKGIDGRTRDARRFRDLVDSFSASRGGESALSEADKALVRTAAALAVKAERMQAGDRQGRRRRPRRSDASQQLRFACSQSARCQAPAPRRDDDAELV